MALFDQTYTPPGVYTTETFTASTVPLSGTGPVTILIGEGEEVFTVSDYETHRGSSATSDDQIVGENLSAQVGSDTRTFQLSHFPVVTGDGSGTVTNDPTKVSLVAGGVPLTLIALNGATGLATSQTIVPEGTNVTAQYYFKRTDTPITNEDLSVQVPTFASVSIASGALVLGLSIPGELGNLVSFALTESQVGVSDALAVSGAGTDAISVELTKTDGTVRKYSDVATLISTGIPTQDGGYLTVSSSSNGTAAVLASTQFIGGAGPSSNTTFKLANVPVVDGTNGGITTNSASGITVTVNGSPVTVAALDGVNGLVTLTSPVVSGASVKATYYTNTYQNTADVIADGNVTAVSSVGLAPGRADFVQGTDYVLDNGSINWGAAALVDPVQSTAGYTPLDGTAINTTLVDEKVYLRPAVGSVDGRNSVFVLEDVPVDGSGLSRPTSDPALVAVYVGTNPVSALLAGPVKVSRLVGASGSVTLYNPPATNSKVYVSYFRSTLDTHVFTLTVDNPGIPGQGTYSVQDELARVLPVATEGASVVTDANFADLGLVWPSAFPDLAAALGGAAETVTLTFQDDGLTTTSTAAAQASLTISESGAQKIAFTASTPGSAANAVTVSFLGGPTGATDANAITVTGSAVTVATVFSDNTTVRTWQQVVALFAAYPPTVAGAGTLLCSGVSGADLTVQATSFAATHLTGGVDAVTASYANRYVVSTSRTAAQAKADSLGLTGGVTTPSVAGLSGYLGQTYIDPVTALKFTVVDPKQALSYGYTQLPSPSYTFKPGDTLTFTVAQSAFTTGATPTIAIPGLRTEVVTTYGMKSGDTASLSTYASSGNEPAVGDYYYVSYTKSKLATDFGLALYDSPEALYNVAGQPSVINRLSLGAYLYALNGGGQFGAIQVQKQTGLGVASDQAFIDAIQSLSKNLPGSTRKADIIVPLSTSATVQQALAQFQAKQAGPRYKGESQSFIGVDQFSTVSTQRSLARSIKSQRVVQMGLNSLGILLQPTATLVAVEYAVTGEFLAAAMAGLRANGTNDVATTLTGQTIVGFSRALTTFDDPTMDLMAADGITCFVEVPGGLKVRHYKTTDPSNALTSEPYITTTADFIAQAMRSGLEQYEGRKMVSGLTTTIAVACNSFMSGWMNNLITAYTPAVVTQDANDPTTIDVTIAYKPMWSLLYIQVSFQVNLG